MRYTMRPDGQRSCRFRIAGAGSCKPASASCASQGRRAGKLPKRAGPQAPPPAAPRCRCRLRRQTPPPPLLPPLQHWRPVHPPPGVQSWPAAVRAWGPVSVSRSASVDGRVRQATYWWAFDRLRPGAPREPAATFTACTPRAPSARNGASCAPGTSSCAAAGSPPNQPHLYTHQQHNSKLQHRQTQCAPCTS